MQEIPPILRRNIKYNRLIQSTILICSMTLLITSAASNNNKVEQKVKKEVTYETQSVGLLAGACKCFFETIKEPVPKLDLEKLEKTTVTKSEPLYKSIEEIKLSRDMNLAETIGVSREDFCKLLADFKYDYNGFYKKNAGLIWDLSQKYQVNEIFMCGVFALESYYGSDESHIAAHNYGSIMPDGKLKKFETDEEGIEANFKLFADCYLTPEGKYYKGVTLEAIGDTYCPPTQECPSWSNRVYDCMQKFVEE